MKKLIPAVLLLLAACSGNTEQTKEESKNPDNEVKQETTNTLIPDTFSTFPPEIMGCSCYFAASEKEFDKAHYIYMDTPDSIAVFKVNGNLEKLKLLKTESADKADKSTYKNDNYELIIEKHDGIKHGEETWRYKGVIQINSKDGKSTKMDYYGECGC